MKNFNLIFISVFCFLANTAFTQTFETIDRIDWSAETGLNGTTANGTSWDARGNDANDCDGDGSFGIQGDAFIINAWEGSCGCPCGPNDPSADCGQNDSEIEVQVPSSILSPYCSVRVQVPVSSSATLECGTNNDMTVDDIDLGGCLEPGTDFLEVFIRVFNADGSRTEITREVCGTFNGVIEETFDEAVLVTITIRGGTQEIDEFYELGDILVEGVRRDLASVTIFAINSDNGVICENSSRPLILQTNAPSPDQLDFVWSGPNNFISTDSEVRFDQGDLDPSRQGTYALQITDVNGCIIEETVDIIILPATDAQCTSMPEFDFLGIQCSDVILPSVSDNGISGTWSPGAILEQFAGQTLDFTFIPDDPAVSQISMLIQVDDISRLENFAIQPVPIPVFCNASTERFDFIELFQMNLDLRLNVNGEEAIFFFIQNNEPVQAVEAQMRSISLFGISAGRKTFFIEAQSPCGNVNQLTFDFDVVDDAGPLVIDTTLCEGDSFEFMGMDFTESTFIASTNGACGGGTQINIDRLPARRNIDIFIRSSLCAGEAVYVYDTIDPSGNILGGITLDFIPELADNIDTVFRENTAIDYTLPFPASNGCDSIQPINISFRPNNEVQMVQFDLCENLDTLVMAGTQQIRISASNPSHFEQVNCELGIDIQANIIPVQSDSIIRTFCADQDTLIQDFDGNMVLFNRDNPTATFFADSGANGCAESLFVGITFEELGMSEVNEIICVGGSVVVGTQVFTSATSEQIILPGASATGCDSIVMLTIELIEADINATELTCDSPTSILTPTHNGTVVDWVGPDGFTSTEENPEVTAPGIYTLTVAGPDGCTSEFPVNVTQNLMPPTVDAFGGEINCNNNGELTLSVTTDGTFIEWRGPNGFSSTEEMPTISEPGMYEAEAVGPNGCPMVDIVEVTADTIMPIGTAMADTIGCAGGPEVMLNLTTSDIFVEWTGPDGFVSTDINAMVSSGGLYQATIRGGNGCEAQVDLEIIEDFTVPVVTTSDITLDCDGTAIDLTATTDGTITGWSGPDGFNSMEASPSTSAPGIYMVTVVAENGCDTTAMLQVFESGPFPDAEALGGDINCFNSGALELTLVINSGSLVEWTGPDGFRSTEERPTVTVGGTYTALLVGANGCQDSVQAIVNEDLNLPVVTVDPEAAITCASQGQVQLGATTDGNLIDWTGPNGFTSTEMSPFVTDAGTYTVLVVADNGCEETASIEVTLDVDPVMVEALDQVIDCISLVATLDANTSGTIIEWTGPNNFSSTDQNPEVAESGDYTVLVIGDNGCESSAVATVADAVGGPNITDVNLESVCGTMEGILTVTSDGSVLEWIGPSNFVAAEASPTVTEEGEYTVTVINADGCPSTASIMVIFDNTLPQLAVNDDVLTCNNDSTLMLTATTDAGTIAWRGPGGFRSDELNPLVDFPGTYIITATSDSGCEVTDSVIITENFISPQVSVRNEVLSCSNDSTTRLQFTANDGMFLGWTGPGGFSSDEENPVINVPGVYIVSVQGDNGCINETPANIMAASDQTMAVADVTGELTCDVSEVRISATTDGSIVNWMDPDGNIINDIAPLVSVPGTYTVMVESSTNCPGFASVEVLEDINPPNIMGEDVTIGCMNSTVQLSVTTDGDIRGWRDPNGVSIVEDSPVVDMPGTYQVEVEGDNGCIGTFDVEVIPDGDVPELTASIVGELDCSSTQAQLLAVSNATDISWTGPNGFTSTETDPIVFEPGDYTVTAIGSNGCPSTQTVSINFSGIDVQVGQINGSCEGVANGMFVLENVSGATPPFTISGVDGDPVVVESFPFTFEGLFSGDFDVQVLGSDGCMTVIDVTVPEIPAGTLGIDVTTIDVGGGEFDLDLNFDGTIVDVLWSSNPALSCTDCPDPTVTLTENSVFTVTITDDQGCMADAQVSLSVNPESIVNSIYIPNVMTTRSVSGNNRFYPQGNFGQTSRFSMQIFDRWGNEVFQSIDELVNDPTSGWDGLFNGSQANSGVYVYIIEITNEQGNTEIFHGDITLIK